MLTGFYGDADIPFLLGNDFGVAVVIGTNQAIAGITDYVGKDVLASQGVSGISGTDIVVTVQTSILPGYPVPMRNKTTLLTVDGVACRLRDSVQQGDGALMHLVCERVT
jgi:hypothetical protein